MGRFTEQLREAQAQVASRIKAVESGAHKLSDLFAKRAQEEVAQWARIARENSRGQAAILGAELEKIGRKLQDFGRPDAS